MSISDPKLALELAQRAQQLTALRAAFLIAAHHGVALRPEELPRLTEGDMVASACLVSHQTTMDKIIT